LAYEHDRPVIVGDVMYVPGTRSVEDIFADVALAMNMLRFTPAFRVADSMMNPRVTKIVGHSLGAAVAKLVAKRHKIKSVGYGSPVVNDVNYSSPYDLVAHLPLLLESRLPTNMYMYNGQPYLHHSVTGYGIGV